MTNKKLIEFPCYFPIKIIGNNTSLIFNEIKKVTITHFPTIEQDAMTHKISKDSNYISITVTIFAESQRMLDLFYQALTQHPDVLMVL